MVGLSSLILLDKKGDVFLTLCYVNGLQIDELAVLTVKDGAGFEVSGMFKCSPFDSAGVALRFDDEDVLVKIVFSTDDPATVGRPAYSGQRRVYWRGTLELED
jgi:hypothetical protein